MSRKKRKERREKMKKNLTFELYGLILFAISIIGLVQPGAVGRALRGVFRFFAGSWDWMIPLGLFLLACYVMWKKSWPIQWNFRWSGVVLICLSILILSHLNLIQTVTASGQFENSSVIQITWNLYKEDISAENPVQDLGGGMVGAAFYGFLRLLFADLGTKLVLFFFSLIGVLLVTGKSYMDIIIGIRNMFKRLFSWMNKKRKDALQLMEQMKEAEQKEKENEPSIHEYDEQEKDVSPKPSQPMAFPSQTAKGSEEELNPVIHDFTEVAYTDEEQEQQNVKRQTTAIHNHSIDPNDQPLTIRSETDQKAAKPEEITSGELVAYEEEQDYQLPQYTLLKKQNRKSGVEKKGLKSNAAKLEQTLQSFGVNAKVTNVHRGPAVTRYEILPDVGVKVSKIVNLTDDIALALAAKGIRIEAPIPGKSAIGIEVPNEDIAMVSLREVLESSQYHESPSKLTIALGRDISGEPIVAHLNKMPHLLVAGATGSGKSVCINGIIASILYKSKPHEVKLMMIDPKMVELNVYNGIPHLLTPVVTEPRKAAVALKKVVAEMERRYDLFAHVGTRNVEGYNEIIQKENANQTEEKKPLLPYIVVIVDELADLMMVAPGDVEDAICRLAQMARAAGIHLIIATQRPSVDVITGVIKANIPSRIAFGVSSQADSRTILDMGGAEKLLGRGDMLFLPVGASKPFRIQGAFVSDDEVEQMVQHCIEQQKAQYHEEMMPSESDDKGADPNQVQDDLYQDAVDLVINQGSASVSMLQRRFRIGYTRAARLIDSMEENGVVGPYEGSKPREVLISKEESNIS